MEKRLLYSINPRERDSLHADLRQVVESEWANDMVRKDSQQYWLINKYGDWYPTAGLTERMRRRFFPNVVFPRPSKNRVNLASSIEQGNRVERQIHRWMLDPTYTPTNPLARGVVDYFDANGHRLQVVQMPTGDPLADWITQGDMFTVDHEGRLHYWELKTGAGVKLTNPRRFVGCLSELEVPVTKPNIWLLQCFLTAMMYREFNGMRNIHASHVINVYQQRPKDKNLPRRVVVNVLKPPKWLKRVENCPELQEQLRAELNRYI